MRAAALALLAVALLPGCATTSEKLAIRDVPYNDHFSPTGLPPLAVQVQVEAARASEPIADVRIAIRDAGGEYAVLPGTRWREPATELVRNLLVQAFEACHCVAAAQRAGSAARADYLLSSELRELAVVQPKEGGPYAQVSISYTIVRVRDGVAIATTELVREQMLAKRSDPAGVDALAKALNRMAGDSMGWAYAAIAADATR